MLSEPQEFYKTLDVLDSTIVSLFTDHNTQVYNAMQAYQLEYGMTNIQVIKTLSGVIKLYKNTVDASTEHGQPWQPDPQDNTATGTPIK